MIKTRSVMMSLTFLRRFVVLAAICLLQMACDEDNLAPSPANPAYGLTGTVVDSLGQGLDSVGIFCLFNSSVIPPASPGTVLTRFGDVDTFEFALYQNFPNPFSHSTFVRFSLPRDAQILLSLRDSLEGSTKFTYADTLLQGLYQLYLHRFVDSLGLRNGPFTFVLEAMIDGGSLSTDSKDAFVVSDSGASSAITDREGFYFFNYDHAFVGDSVVSTWNGEDIYPFELTNSVYFLFRRSGFRSEVINATLFSNLLLQRDVVLLRGN